MISKFSPFNSIEFIKDSGPFDRAQRFAWQPVNPNDRLSVQYMYEANSPKMINIKVYDTNGVQTAFFTLNNIAEQYNGGTTIYVANLGIYLKNQQVNSYYRLVASMPSPYGDNIIGTAYVYITRELSDTKKVVCSHNFNDYDTIFLGKEVCTDGVVRDISFSCRFPARIYEPDDTYTNKLNTFRDQRYNNNFLSGFLRIIKKMIIGSGQGVPKYYIDKIALYFSVSSTYIIDDDVSIRCVLSGDMPQISTGNREKPFMNTVIQYEECPEPVLNQVVLMNSVAITDTIKRISDMVSARADSFVPDVLDTIVFAYGSGDILVITNATDIDTAGKPDYISYILSPDDNVIIKFNWAALTLPDMAQQDIVVLLKRANHANKRLVLNFTGACSVTLTTDSFSGQVSFDNLNFAESQLQTIGPNTYFNIYAKKTGYKSKFYGWMYGNDRLTTELALLSFTVPSNSTNINLYARFDQTPYANTLYATKLGMGVRVSPSPTSGGNINMSGNTTYLPITVVNTGGGMKYLTCIDDFYNTLYIAQPNTISYGARLSWTDTYGRALPINVRLSQLYTGSDADSFVELYVLSGGIKYFIVVIGGVLQLVTESYLGTYDVATYIFDRGLFQNLFS